jgi:cell pole-organizing protein PopZ
MSSSNASLSGTRQMTQAAKAQEPSMEEILASIRRIIADDDAAKSPPPPEPPKAPPVAPPPLRPVAVAPPPPPEPAFVPVPVEPSVNESVLDEMLAELNATPAPAEAMAADVLDLTEDMAAPADPPAAGFRTIDGQSDIVFEDNPPENYSEPPAREAPRLQFPERPRALMSSSTSAAVDSAFNTLAHTILVQNARTLEDLVKEMLQPLLKSWLDDNLPGLVERLVRAEIERVSRGRG